MEAITAIITAIVAGAAEALQETGKQAVLDLYVGIKKLIQDKYQKASSSLEALEKKPDSASKRDSLKEDLHDLGAANDNELLKQAQALLTAIEEHSPDIAKAMGLSLKEVKAANLFLKEVAVHGEQATGVQIEKSEFSGDIKIDKIKVGASTEKK